MRNCKKEKEEIHTEDKIECCEIKDADAAHAADAVKKSEESTAEADAKQVAAEENGVENQSDETEKIKKQLEEKANQAEEYYDRLLRLQADFDNFRKRTLKEREETYNIALESVIKQILPVVDNLDRAIASFKADNLESKYVDGLDMINKQLISILVKNGVIEIDAEGKEFDPNLHHAVMQVEAAEGEENLIKQVLQKGYMLNSKVIRPALVQVAVK